MTASVAYRRATPADLTALRALAMQVYLDTYATQGISESLAREVFAQFSAQALALRLADPAVEITVAERAGHLVGFLDMAASTASPCPVAAIQGAEVCRLYVQQPFQRAGVGRQLLRRAEDRAAGQGSPWLWLTAWSGNQRALVFYARMGYQDMGATQHWIDGVAHENRVLARWLDGPAPALP